MTLLVALSRGVGTVRRILGRGGSDDSDQLGPEAIAAARQELRMDDRVSEARVGKARLEDYSGAFTTDLKAVVPLETHRYEDPAPLTFDVDGDDLAAFCDAYDVDVDHIGALEGATVPLRWEQGAPVPDWKALEQADDEEVTA